MRSELSKKEHPGMHMKMAVLVKKSGETKSTILYYVKEGLLPSPRKPKPNLHLYHQSCVDRLKFIKLLQDHFSCSIDDIKAIMKKSQFDEGGLVQRLVNIIQFELGDISSDLLFENDVLIQCGIQLGDLQKLIDSGLIVPSQGKYTRSDVDLILFYKELSELGIDADILKTYATYSRKIAEAEAEFAQMMAKLDIAEGVKQDKLVDVLFKTKKQLFLHHRLDALNNKIMDDA